MARLYANENFPVDVVRELRALGHDVLTTHDRAVPIHAGIIVCTENRDYTELARRIDREISRVPSLANQLLRVVRGDR